MSWTDRQPATVAALDLVANADQRGLVDTGVLVGTGVLAACRYRRGVVGAISFSCARTTIRPASTWSTTPATQGVHGDARVAGHGTLIPVPTSASANAGWNGLALHVRAHQRAGLRYRAR